MNNFEPRPLEALYHTRTAMDQRQQWREMSHDALVEVCIFLDRAASRAVEELEQERDRMEAEREGPAWLEPAAICLIAFLLAFAVVGVRCVLLHGGA